MPLIRVLLALLVLSAMAPLPAAAGEELSPETRADIERLLEMTDALAAGKQMGMAMSDAISASLKQARPDIPQQALDALREEVGAVMEENMPAFREITVHIYGKYFTGPEIREMIAFYSTPVGRKSVRVMPTMFQESLEAGKLWGQSLGPVIEERVRARLKREGVEI